MQKSTPSHLLEEHTFPGNSEGFYCTLMRMLMSLSSEGSVCLSKLCHGPRFYESLQIHLCQELPGCRYGAKDELAEHLCIWNICLSLEPVTCCLCPPPQLSQSLCKRWNVQRGIKTGHSWRRGGFGNLLFFVSAAQAFPWCCPLFFQGFLLRQHSRGLPELHPADPQKWLATPFGGMKIMSGAKHSLSLATSDEGAFLFCS